MHVGEKVNKFRQVCLIMATYIDSIMYPNKNHEVFQIGLIHVVNKMCQGV